MCVWMQLAVVTTTYYHSHIHTRKSLTHPPLKPPGHKHTHTHTHTQAVRKQQGLVTTTYYDSTLESRVRGARAPQMPVNLLAVVFDKFACIQEDYTHTHKHTHAHTYLLTQVVICGSVCLFLLHNHFITDFFKKKIRRSKRQRNYSVLLYRVFYTLSKTPHSTPFKARGFNKTFGFRVAL